MQTAINLVSTFPMRKEPDHRSEMVSQLLLGEYAEVLESDKDFYRIKCIYDDYEGWVQANQLVFTDALLEPGLYATSWCSEVTVNDNRRRLPFASPVYSEGIYSVGKHRIDYTGIQTMEVQDFSEEALAAVYKCFLDTPYFWGGKSVFGIDCSGFVQQVFKLFGVKLLRDAYLQAEQGTVVGSLEDASSGDLAFFQNEKGRVTHVGIILTGNRIVHASGRVRIDTIDSAGIFNEEVGKRTHEMHSIRRILTA
jgi:gamma-D-glutamyl-L-lysine dipeptidyl-peptidase